MWWATRSIVQVGAGLVGNPAYGGLSTNPRLRHIHSHPLKQSVPVARTNEHSRPHQVFVY
jgi:hypothetical protein